MEEKVTYFGQTNFRNKKVKFGIKIDDRRRHVYVIGKTGMGKSQLLENMVVSDIRHGFGVAVVDPHGDLVEGILKYIPRNRLEDVVYFNPADAKFPIAFNVLETVGDQYRTLVADGVVGVFKKIWADSWGPRLEYILRNAILALLEDKDSTLLGVVRILTDRKYRESVVKEVTDPVIRYFWTKEFPKYPDKDIATIIGPIQNKVGQYLSNSIIRNIVGQTKSTINIREIMDNRKILLLNLSKGRIGEDTSNLLGALMITKIQLAAMSRVDIPEDDRQDFYLYVDELQNFATDSFGGILSEARKYHLNMTLAHQYVEQLPEALQAAVFGNVGSIISFRVGAVDAEHLAKEFAPTFIEEDFVNLPKFSVYLKLMIDGVASHPFSAGTLPPVGRLEGYEDQIIKFSRETYAKPVSIVEQAIIEWWDLEDKKKNAAKKEGPTETVKKQIAKIKKEKGPVLESETVPEIKVVEASNKFDYSTVDWHNLTLQNKEASFDGVYICDVCGVNVHLEFDPRLDKPILCYKCVKKRDKFFKKQKRDKEEARLEAIEKKDQKVKKSEKDQGDQKESRKLEVKHEKKGLEEQKGSKRAEKAEGAEDQDGRKTSLSNLSSPKDFQGKSYRGTQYAKQETSTVHGKKHSFKKNDLEKLSKKATIKIVKSDEDDDDLKGLMSLRPGQKGRKEPEGQKNQDGQDSSDKSKTSLSNLSSPKDFQGKSYRGTQYAKQEVSTVHGKKHSLKKNDLERPEKDQDDQDKKNRMTRIERPKKDQEIRKEPEDQKDQSDQKKKVEKEIKKNQKDDSNHGSNQGQSRSNLGNHDSRSDQGKAVAPGEEVNFD